MSFYSTERNVQILVHLLKANNIRRIIASPGTTNVTFVGTVQHDDFFKMYSCVDERSAAYMACGMAAESGEPVVIVCTGATASRNYVPGLTEAYYRKLPVLAVTASQPTERVGHLAPQLIDRSQLQHDIAVLSVSMPNIKDSEDEWFCEINANRAMAALTRRGGGPVHINLETHYSADFSAKKIPPCRIVKYFTHGCAFPEIKSGRVAVIIGNHRKFGQDEVLAIENFCIAYDAAVFCDHTSGYNGAHKVLWTLCGSQKDYESPNRNIDLLIHIGEISGDYFTQFVLRPLEVWRVNEDGEMRDWFKKLSAVFEMSEKEFFSYYANKNVSAAKPEPSFAEKLNKENDMIYSHLPELPFSNYYIANQCASKLPENSVLHLGILSSLRSWNYFKIPPSVSAFSNTGGFGIDGGVSSMLGAALVNPEKLYFGVFGDLAFFYDMNSIGNRHLPSNIRIMLINNGVGQEFRNKDHLCYIYGIDSLSYVGAAGHYGNKSKTLVKHYAEDLGFEYLSAHDKKSFAEIHDRFFSAENVDKPVFFEVFTNTEDETEALDMIKHCYKNKAIAAKNEMKKAIKSFIGQSGVDSIKGILKK